MSAILSGAAACFARNPVYCTREHDSLRISNGKWYWFSQGFGGYLALDYLVKVRKMPFLEAMERLNGGAARMPPFFAPKKHGHKLILPSRSQSSGKVAAYLLGRGIARPVIDYCLHAGLLYS